jgi:hypothetical protein
MTDFTDAAEGKPPRAVTPVQVVYLLENLGDKLFGAIQERAHLLVAGKADWALRGPEHSYHNGENHCA